MEALEPEVRQGVYKWVQGNGLGLRSLLLLGIHMGGEKQTNRRWTEKLKKNKSMPAQLVWLSG